MMISIPTLTTADIREISEACEGYCQECPVEDICPRLQEFMEDAGADFENQYQVVIEDLFSDPAECDRLRREELNDPK